MIFNIWPFLACISAPFSIKNLNVSKLGAYINILYNISSLLICISAQFSIKNSNDFLFLQITEFLSNSPLS